MRSGGPVWMRALAAATAVAAGSLGALALADPGATSGPSAETCLARAHSVFAQGAREDTRSVGRCLAAGADPAGCLDPDPWGKPPSGCEAFAPDVPDEAEARATASEGATALIGGIYGVPSSTSAEGKRSPEGRCEVFAWVAAGACWSEHIAGFDAAGPPGDVCGVGVDTLVDMGCNGVDVAGLFPGCAPADGEDLARCLRQRAACQACRSLADLERTSLDCDRYDDGLPNASCGEPAGPPAHLVLLAAGIEELAPIDPEDVAGRGVVLRVELAGMPACDAGTGRLSYGFLVDADRNPATGSALPAFSPLGIDARLAARCNPASGGFESPLGPVTLHTDATDGRAVLEIHTSVALLPSVDLQWIAFGAEDGGLVRLPPAPWSWAWTTHERALF